MGLDEMSYTHSVHIGSELRTLWKVKVCVYGRLGGGGGGGTKLCWFGRNRLDSARYDTCRSKLDGGT